MGGSVANVSTANQIIQKVQFTSKSAPTIPKEPQNEPSNPLTIPKKEVKESTISPILNKESDSEPITETIITPSMVEEPEPTTKAATQNGSLKRKPSKFDTPSLSLLEEEEENEEIDEKTIILDKKILQESWDSFTKQVKSPSVKVVFQKAILKVKDECTIEIEVGSQMAKGMVQQEKELIPFLRKCIPIPNLAMEITIDPQKVKDLLPTKKLLSTKEIYELMRKKNPMVHELRLRLDLKPDNQ